VSCAGPVELSCEIDTTQPVVRGRVRVRPDRCVEFDGWLDLVATLMALAEDIDSHSSPTSQETHR
jgi:hypothetical protein